MCIKWRQGSVVVCDERWPRSMLWLYVTTAASVAMCYGRWLGSVLTTGDGKGKYGYVWQTKVKDYVVDVRRWAMAATMAMYVCDEQQPGSVLCITDGS